MLSCGPMAASPVELRVGGQSYRVVSSASPRELQRLADVVNDKLSSLLPPGRAASPQALLLVALALANDVELERKRAAQVKDRSRAALADLVGEVEAALGVAEGLAKAVGASGSDG